VEESTSVSAGLTSFYAQFSSHDPDGFASVLATCPGVSVIGTAPGEGHDDRESWIETYAKLIPDAGLRLEGGPEPRGFAEGSVGFAVDEPRFVLPDGSFLPARLTAVLRQEDEQWKVVHLHLSVGVPDEDAIQPAS
jgi:hypothetical protein